MWVNNILPNLIIGIGEMDLTNSTQSQNRNKKFMNQFCSLLLHVYTSTSRNVIIDSKSV